jgi:hypothetical protein
MCRAIALAYDGVGMNLWITVFQRNVADRRKQFELLCRETDGSYFFVFQLGHPRRTDERAPIALKLAEASLFSEANALRAWANSSLVSNTRTKVFGFSSTNL